MRRLVSVDYRSRFQCTSGCGKTFERRPAWTAHEEREHGVVSPCREEGCGYGGRNWSRYYQHCYKRKHALDETRVEKAVGPWDWGRTEGKDPPGSPAKTTTIPSAIADPSPHGGELLYTCTSCQARCLLSIQTDLVPTFTSKLEWACHEETVHGVKWECENCGRTFAAWHSGYQHEQQCGHVVGRKRLLRALEGNTMGAMFICTSGCISTFETRIAWIDHEERVHGVRWACTAVGCEFVGMNWASYCAHCSKTDHTIDEGGAIRQSACGEIMVSVGRTNAKSADTEMFGVLPEDNDSSFRSPSDEPASSADYLPPTLSTHPNSPIDSAVTENIYTRECIPDLDCEGTPYIVNCAVDTLPETFATTFDETAAQLFLDLQDFPNPLSILTPSLEPHTTATSSSCPRTPKIRESLPATTFGDLDANRPLNTTDTAIQTFSADISTISDDDASRILLGFNISTLPSSFAERLPEPHTSPTCISCACASPTGVPSTPTEPVSPSILVCARHEQEIHVGGNVGSASRAFVIE